LGKSVFNIIFQGGIGMEMRKTCSCFFYKEFPSIVTAVTIVSLIVMFGMTDREENPEMYIKEACIKGIQYYVFNKSSITPVFSEKKELITCK
jgi:hypothetical protein